MISRGWLWAATVGAVVALSTFAARRAQAVEDARDEGMNLHQVYLPLDGHGFYVVDDPETLDQWQAHGFLNYSHAFRPLEASTGVSSNRTSLVIVDRQDTLDVGGSVGLLPKDGFVIRGLSVGFDLPINIHDDGQQLPLLDRSIGSGGAGALRLQVKADLLELEEDTGKDDKDARPLWSFSLGLKPFLTLPTGRVRQYLDDRDNPTGGAMVESALKVWHVRFGLEAGYEFTPHIVLGDQSLHDRIRWGTALEVLILDDQAPWAEKPAESLRHTVGIGMEAYGWADADHFFGVDRQRPAEGFAYLRYANSWGLQFAIGYGLGLDHGISAARDRFMVHLGWTF